MNSLERKKITEAIPWVHRLVKARQCDGRRGKCRNKAYWTFRALKRVPYWSAFAKDGNYCWIHLCSDGLYYTQEEGARFDKWYAKFRAGNGGSNG